MCVAASVNVISGEVLHVLLAHEELVVALLSVFVVLGDLDNVAVVVERGDAKLDDQVNKGARRSDPLADNFERCVDDLGLSETLERFLGVRKGGRLRLGK